MKIEELRLRNFSAIDNAMNAKEIRIDFRKGINKICLLVGPNGSGKTTILGLLSPFSDYGNLDVRNGNQLILKDKEGYKEIHIKKGESHYVIKHFYYPHKDKNHSVKSYIEKDGVELNVNGNVTSFKEYVKEELQIESDYLRLIRLGANVTSLIGLSSTERKNFMSKIMDDIGIYLKYYKAVNGKLHQLNEMISHCMNKIDQLCIVDENDILSQMDVLRKDISLNEDLLLKEMNQIAVYRSHIDSIHDLAHLRENTKAITKKYKKMRAILDRKHELESEDVSYYKEKITNTNMMLQTLATEKKNAEILYETNMKLLDTLHDQLRDVKIKEQKNQENEEELRKMDAHVIELRKMLRTYEKSLDGFSPDYSKEEFDEFYFFLKRSQDILNTTYEFNPKSIKKVMELIVEGVDVISYINKHILDIDDMSGDNGSSLLYILKQRFDGTFLVDCERECPAKQLLSQIDQLLKDAKTDEESNDISFYREMEMAYKNISMIITELGKFASLIEKLPDFVKSKLKKGEFAKIISKQEMIYDEGKMNDLISLITDYNNYINVSNQLEDAEATLSKVTSMSLDEGGSKSKDVEDEVVIVRAKIHSIRNDIATIKESSSELLQNLERYEDTIETLEKYEEVEKSYESFTKDLALYEETDVKIKECDVQANNLRYTINSQKKELQELISKKDMYDSLRKELKTMNRIYDDMEYIKRASSSKEGIPLRIIMRYLDNTEEITNELLDIAYGGDIFMDQFNITATEFSMPFYNKGVYLPDVKYASQGELSFLSIALSFALSSQVLKHYNIMLLDEIDGPLDVRNRAKFIEILENQIDRIQSEQNFLITHNDMFSSYPVDIIYLDPSFKGNYEYANEIKIEKIK